MDKNKKPMFQVHVTDTEHKYEIPVGPAMDDEKALYGLASHINVSVIKGRIKGWKDAHIKKVNKVST